MIKNIIFDLGGVITLQGNADLQSFDKRFDLSAGTLGRIARDCFQKMSSQKDFDEASYFKGNYQEIVPWEKYKEAISSLNAVERVNQPLVDWIRSKQNNYCICLLTNNSPALDMLLYEKYKIRDLFCQVFNSVDIGVSKPSPEIFKYILEKLSAKVEECVSIDDSMENVKSAERLGFHGVIFRDNESLFSNFQKLGL